MQEVTHAGFLWFALGCEGLFRTGFLACGWTWRRAWSRLLRALWMRVFLLLNRSAAMGAVRLRDIAVIHHVHLPDEGLPKKMPAMLAILAARMARSSLLIRAPLKYGRSACSSFF